MYRWREWMKWWPMMKCLDVNRLKNYLKQNNKKHTLYGEQWGEYTHWYLTISHLRRCEYRQIVTETNARWLFALVRASDISREKKENFMGFSGANSRKNRLISWEKSQNLRKNRLISQDFSEKKSNFEGFSEANS